MDLTPEFRKIAATHASHTGIPRQKPDTRPDAFLAEARRLYEQMLQVQEYLKRTRKAYLSNDTSGIVRNTNSLRKVSGPQDEVLHLTETQRDEIDYEVKKSIREASNRVKELEALEQHRRQIVEKSGSFLSRLIPNAEEKALNDLLATHRSSVIWYLNHTLVQVNQRHASARTARLAREEDRRLAAHSTRTSSEPRYAYSLTEEDSKTSQIETDMAVRETLLSPEQLQEFESENAQIMEEFEHQLSQVRSVQTKLLDIAELSNELQQHLSSQTEMTDRLMTEAEQTTMEVSKGNEQLVQAKQRNKTFRLFITVIFLVLGFSILFLDYYAS